MPSQKERAPLSRPFGGPCARFLAAGTIALAMAALLPAAAIAAEPESVLKADPEVSPAARKLLDLLNTATRSALLNSPGMSEAAVSKLMAFREAGRKLENLVELRRVTGIGSAELEAALKPFQDAEKNKAMEATRKPVPPPPASGKAAGRLKTDTGAGAVDKAQDGPIGEVRPGYYAVLPGYDSLDKIDAVKRTEFLERINREMCTCGCQNETLAFCLVNDPGCPVVKARVKKIYDDIMSKPPR